MQKKKTMFWKFIFLVESTVPPEGDPGPECPPDGNPPQVYVCIA